MNEVTYPAVMMFNLLGLMFVNIVEGGSESIFQFSNMCSLVVRILSYGN